LSASNSSIISLSSALEIVEDSMPYSINASTGSLILSSSKDIVAVSSSLVFEPGHRFYHISANNGHLIMSSAFSSTVAFSSSVKMILDSQATRHFYATGAPLIFSASGGVTVSGSIRAAASVTSANSTPFQGPRSQVSAGNYPAYGFIGQSNIGFGASTNDAGPYISDGDSTYGASGGPALNIVQGFGVQVRPNVKIGWAPGALNGNLYMDTGWMRLTSSVVGLSSSVASQSTTLVGMRGDFILSASNTSVIALSGILKPHYYTQANLPVGSDNISGSIAWVSDSKFLAVYGPEGWTRILTASM
jgi:hypothetical protein